MYDAWNRLTTLLVRDVMTPAPLEIPVTTTLREAAEQFAEHEVTGAPVVDAGRRCVGVVSSSDFLRAFTAGAKTESGKSYTDRAVGSVIAGKVYAVSADESMIDAARIMCDHHVHRAIVLDDKQHPVGIVTAIDIVAAILNAMDESRE